MNVTKHAVAGTLESSDVFLEVLPNPDGIVIDLASSVMRQYGDAIRRVIREVLAENGIENVLVKADDRGALDCVIRARLETALARAGKEAGQ